MKSIQSIVILAALSGLQLLSGTQAQALPAFPNAAAASPSSASTSSTAASAPSATPSGGVVTPSPPTFINTPGLQVNTPYDGMQVTQNSFLSISASLKNGQPIGKFPLVSLSLFFLFHLRRNEYIYPITQLILPLYSIPHLFLIL
jgi:hypothetical protein